MASGANRINFVSARCVPGFFMAVPGLTLGLGSAPHVNHINFDVRPAAMPACVIPVGRGAPLNRGALRTG